MTKDYNSVSRENTKGRLKDYIIFQTAFCLFDNNRFVGRHNDAAAQTDIAIINDC